MLNIALFTTNENASIINVYSKNCKSLKIDDLFGKMIDLFKNEAIKFLPIVDKDNTFVNLVTKEQMHALMLQEYIRI